MHACVLSQNMQPLSKNVAIYLLAKLTLDFKRYLRQAAWITKKYLGHAALITKKCPGQPALITNK